MTHVTKVQEVAATVGKTTDNLLAQIERVEEAKSRSASSFFTPSSTVGQAKESLRELGVLCKALNAALAQEKTPPPPQAAAAA